MDPLTHGLASYALKRGFFPRLPKSATSFIIASGVVADLDGLSYLFGPSAFLTWHRTYTHSFVLTLVVSLLFGVAALLVLRRHDVNSPLLPVLAACLGAGFLHLAMDICQCEAVSLLWPFRPSRIAFDWLPNLDFWLAGILLFAILIPELFLLVGSEIGAKSKRPRGRNAAVVGFAALALYVGVREIQHARAVGILRSATFSEESPVRLAAIPDSASLLTLHGIVETQSAIHLIDVPLAPGAYFIPDSALTIHKPGDSPVLQAARASPAARTFLKFARFPKATVQHETNGYSVEIRDLFYTAAQQSLGAVEANINLDASGTVTFDQLEWQNDVPRR